MTAGQDGFRNARANTRTACYGRCMLRLSSRLGSTDRHLLVSLQGPTSTRQARFIHAAAPIRQAAEAATGGAVLAR